MENQIFKWHLIGFIFINIVGSLFHFVFEWSGYWPPIGAISAVNESVWEHLKLVFWPLVFFSLIEYRFIKEEANNIIFGKELAAYLMLFTIVAIFYTYEFITGSHLFLVDIASFVISIIVGQVVSYKILTASQVPKIISVLSWISIIFLGFCFVLFTYFPPHLPIFMDSTNGTYGIAVST